MRRLSSSLIVALVVASVQASCRRTPTQVPEGLEYAHGSTVLAPTPLSSPTPMSLQLTPTAAEGERALALPLPAPAAVVELFTSEGCSSCPPADAVLAAIAEEADRSGRRVFALALHVDYWNDLGWADPFSAAQYSKRQRAYAARFGLRSVYTPQLVVNGRDQIVGSDGRAARALIERALSSRARAAIALDGRGTSSVPDRVEVRYRVGAPLPGAADITMMLAQDTAEVRVPRGENAGRTLQHRHVVRALVTRPAADAQVHAWTAQWPKEVPLASAIVVAFVSDRATAEVLGATATRVSLRTGDSNSTH